MNTVKINLATKDELMTLNKVGEKMAERIMLYRQEVGYFDNIEDLKQVKGVGDTLINLNKDRLDFELPIQERMERMRNKVMDEYVNPLTGVFIKGEQTGDRDAARRAMNKLKERYLEDIKEGWELVVEWATTEFKAHKQEESMDILDESMLPTTDEKLLEEAGKNANLWLKVKGGAPSRLDKDSQQYVDTLEELLHLKHKLDTELVGRSPEENNELLHKIEVLEYELLGLEMKIKENYVPKGDRSSMDRFFELEEADKYIRRLQLNTTMSTEKDLRDEMAYLDDDRTASSDNLEDYNEYEEAKWDVMLPKSPQLKWLNKPAKGWTEGGMSGDEITTRIQDNNWHNRYMREEAEKIMKAILDKRKKDHGIAVHGQYMEEGKLKVFIFPETEALLSKYRAKLKDMANSMDESAYYTKLGDERRTMLRLFSGSQTKGQERYRVEFIKQLKKDLAELRNIFFLPYGREELRKAQQEHIQKGKAMKWLPTVCKKDLQLSYLGFRNNNGVLVKKPGNPLAFLNKENIITLYNDGVARLLAMGVQESDLSNFRGSVFLKTYEQHMVDQGKTKEAEAAIKARRERDENIEEQKLRAKLNEASQGAQVVKGDQGIAKVFDDNDEEIGLDYVGEMPSPEELAMAYEILSDDF